MIHSSIVLAQCWLKEYYEQVFNKSWRLTKQPTHFEARAVITAYKSNKELSAPRLSLHYSGSLCWNSSSLHEWRTAEKNICSVTWEQQSRCEAARSVEMGCCSVCNDCLVCTDGQAGGCLKKIIPEHSAVSSPQPLMTCLNGSSLFVSNSLLCLSWSWPSFCAWVCFKGTARQK